MRPRFLRPAETAIAPPAEQARVQPLLADLLAQGARAAALPAWARPARAQRSSAMVARGLAPYCTQLASSLP